MPALPGQKKPRHLPLITNIIRATMIAFLRKVWPFVRPYRGRLILGLLSGVLFALASVALIATIQLVVNFVFGKDAEAAFDKQLTNAPAFVQHAAHWLLDHLRNIRPTSRWELALVVATIPAVMFCRSVFAYLNVYFMTWS